MRTWWSWLTASPARLAGAGTAAVAVIAAVAVLGFRATDGDDTDEAAATDEPVASGSVAPGAVDDPDAVPSPEVLPPDRDEYCPAFDDIREGTGVRPKTGDEDTVDLAELGKTFDELIDKYGRAERVSPTSLRDDYALTLGYLREGRKAVDSENVELLKALVVNLNSLNDSMASIQSKSAEFCA